MKKFYLYLFILSLFFSACKLQDNWVYTPQPLYLTESRVEQVPENSTPELVISRVETDNSRVRLHAHLLDAQGNFINLSQGKNQRSLVCMVLDQLNGRDNMIQSYDVQEFDLTNDSGEIAYAMVLDHSGSMSMRVNDMQQAVSEFIQRKRPQDAISIVKYDKIARLEVPLSNDVNFLNTQFRRNGLNGYGGVTAILNGINEGIESLRNAPQRRKIVISFTDGGDNSSTISKDYVIWLARTLNIQVCTIDLGRSVNSNFMREIAEATGGTYNRMMYASEFPNVFTDIRNRLSKSYVIEYETPGMGAHTVSIKMCLPTVHLTAQTTYNNTPVSVVAPVRDVALPGKPPKTDGRPVRPPAQQNPSKQWQNRPVTSNNTLTKDTKQKPSPAPSRPPGRPDLSKGSSTTPSTTTPNKGTKPLPGKPNTSSGSSSSSNSANPQKETPPKLQPGKPINNQGSSSNNSTNSGSKQPPKGSTSSGQTLVKGSGNKGRVNDLTLAFPFKTGTSNLIYNSAFTSAINELLTVLNANPNHTVLIESHTDNLLPANEATSLTQARATAIKGELTQRGIAESRISTSGKGSANPIGDNSTPAGRAQNNRIIAKFN